MGQRLEKNQLTPKWPYFALFPGGKNTREKKYIYYIIYISRPHRHLMPESPKPFEGHLIVFYHPFQRPRPRTLTRVCSTLKPLSPNLRCVWLFLSEKFSKKSQNWVYSDLTIALKYFSFFFFFHQHRLRCIFSAHPTIGSPSTPLYPNDQRPLPTRLMGQRKYVIAVPPSGRKYTIERPSTRYQRLDYSRILPWLIVRPCPTLRSAVALQRCSCL